jgi:hypothetical protein
MLNSPKFVQTRNPNLSNWSSLKRRLGGLTANDLISTLGEPWIRAHHGERSTSSHYFSEHGEVSLDGKVTLEWHFLDTYGRLVTLYDYKQNAANNPDEVIIWSIGGFDPEPAAAFEVWLLAQIAMVKEPRSDDDQFEYDDAMAGWDTEGTECTHCNGFGSSLKEAAARCTNCGGTGLVE